MNRTRAADAVLAVEFELNGQRFIGLNCARMYKFTEAVSCSVECETQEEVDYFSDLLPPAAARRVWSESTRRTRTRSRLTGIIQTAVRRLLRRR